MFRSAREPGRGTDPDDEEGGIVVESGETATMEGLTIATGTHFLNGEFTIRADISVGDHSIAIDSKPPEATLEVEADSEILFENDTDLENIGSDSGLAEIVVQKGSTLTIRGGHSPERDQQCRRSGLVWDRQPGDRETHQHDHAIRLVLLQEGGRNFHGDSHRGGVPGLWHVRRPPLEGR